jgi:hypothetical protein
MNESDIKAPKVFISYSWTSQEYKEQVLDIADRLIKEDGVEVIVDEYDLKGGQDVVAFMEKLRTDKSISHVLVMCDQAYVSKADGRSKGVGIEAQIISPDVYKEVGQTRVLPVVMERTSDGDACLPTFLQSRLYFDFSSPESMHREWERLGRHLWGKPMRTKPSKGAEPRYLSETSGGRFVGLKSIWQALRVALHDDKPKMAVLRHDLLDCFESEMLASTIPPDGADSGEALINYWETCLAAQNEPREVLLDWALTESRIDAERAVAKCLIPLMERINAIPRTKEGTPGPNPAAVDAMAVLGYEMSLYCTACLIEADSPRALRHLLEHPFSDRSAYRHQLHTCMAEFCHYSSLMEVWNGKQERQKISPIAHRIFERCVHPLLNQVKLVEAEALLFLVNTLQEKRWYPYSAVYASHGARFPWFQKAFFSRTPDRLVILTGLDTWESVRDSFVEKFQTITRNSRYEVFTRGRANYLEMMGMDQTRG